MNYAAIIAAKRKKRYDNEPLENMPKEEADYLQEQMEDEDAAEAEAAKRDKKKKKASIHAYIVQKAKNK